MPNTTCAATRRASERGCFSATRIASSSCCRSRSSFSAALHEQARGHERHAVLLDDDDAQAVRERRLRGRRDVYLPRRRGRRRRGLDLYGGEQRKKDCFHLEPPESSERDAAWPAGEG